ncbi:uncharacterized protein BXIN_0216 [Babesia sp. Xinjiang]|uniref:uncharacterized protein n=1 Tax=Babesia sp. Xinjiang TaxID=462227 RepID=UPI000A250AF8|nr:uncharacterized protein BXIN_0216 [Babesia sp. Xinjiang]ORM39847.1 hypothetical protein BXIN_0216 [Babesia sp. Xinjiang]
MNNTTLSSMTVVPSGEPLPRQSRHPTSEPCDDIHNIDKPDGAHEPDVAGSDDAYKSENEPTTSVEAPTRTTRWSSAILSGIDPRLRFANRRFADIYDDPDSCELKRQRRVKAAPKLARSNPSPLELELTFSEDEFEPDHHTDISSVREVLKTISDIVTSLVPKIHFKFQQLQEEQTEQGASSGYETRSASARSHDSRNRDDPPSCRLLGSSSDNADHLGACDDLRTLQRDLEDLLHKNIYSNDDRRKIIIYSTLELIALRANYYYRMLQNMEQLAQYSYLTSSIPSEFINSLIEIYRAASMEHLEHLRKQIPVKLRYTGLLDFRPLRQEGHREHVDMDSLNAVLAKFDYQKIKQMQALPIPMRPTPQVIRETTIPTLQRQLSSDLVKFDMAKPLQRKVSNEMGKSEMLVKPLQRKVSNEMVKSDIVVSRASSIKSDSGVVPVVEKPVESTTVVVDSAKDEPKAVVEEKPAVVEEIPVEVEPPKRKRGRPPKGTPKRPKAKTAAVTKRVTRSASLASAKEKTPVAVSVPLSVSAPVPPAAPPPEPVVPEPFDPKNMPSLFSDVSDDSATEVDDKRVPVKVASGPVTPKGSRISKVAETTIEVTSTSATRNDVPKQVTKRTIIRSRLSRNVESWRSLKANDSLESFKLDGGDVLKIPKRKKEAVVEPAKSPENIVSSEMSKSPETVKSMETIKSPLTVKSPLSIKSQEMKKTPLTVKSPLSIKSQEMKKSPDSIKSPESFVVPRHVEKVVRPERLVTPPPIHHSQVKAAPVQKRAASPISAPLPISSSPRIKAPHPVPSVHEGPMHSRSGGYRIYSPPREFREYNPQREYREYSPPRDYRRYSPPRERYAEPPQLRHSGSYYSDHRPTAQATRDEGGRWSFDNAHGPSRVPYYPHSEEPQGSEYYGYYDSRYNGERGPPYREGGYYENYGYRKPSRYRGRVGYNRTMQYRGNSGNYVSDGDSVSSLDSQRH